VRGDFTNADPSGWAIHGLGGPNGNTYGNQFFGIGVEQAPFQPTNTECNYTGVFGLTGYAQGWYAIYESSDTYGSSCVHSATLGANSTDNHLVATVGQFSAGAFDDASNHENFLEDLPNQTYTVRNLLPLFIGKGDTYNNRILNATWADYAVANDNTITVTPGPYSYQTIWVNNSSDGTCASHLGGIKVWCFYDGMHWQPMGNLSSPTFTQPGLGTATATSVLATGIVDGTTPITVTASSTYTLGGTYKSGYTFNQSPALVVTYSLPGGTVAAGQSYCVANSNNGTSAATSQLKLLPDTTQRIMFTNGMLTTAMTGYLESTGAAGDEICVVSVTSTLWQVTGTPRGSWSRN